MLHLTLHLLHLRPHLVTPKPAHEKTAGYVARRRFRASLYSLRVKNPLYSAACLCASALLFVKLPNTGNHAYPSWWT